MPQQNTRTRTPTRADDIDLNEIFTEDRFAKMVHKSLRTVRRWRVNRTGPRCSRTGSTWVYTGVAIRDFLRANEVGGQG